MSHSRGRAQANWDGQPFGGTKIALICADAVVAYLRDDKEGIPFPGLWDLPGGGREGDEDPLGCALRETLEEFGLEISRDSVLSLLKYDGASPEALATYFCPARIELHELAKIRFGGEGERWLLMKTWDFVQSSAAVPVLQQRLVQHLEFVSQQSLADRPL